MGIYISGVSMPKDGKVVLIDPWGNVRLYWSKDVVAVGTGLYLCKTSELPPHGRVIDVDEMERFMSDSVRGDIRSYPYGDETWGEAFRWMDSRPTIIPADPEGSADNG